jgi:YVTN family beta-propeller protein
VTTTITNSNFNLPVGVAVSPDGSKVYVANVLSNTVSVIDTTTNPATVSTIAVGSTPTGVAVSPDGSKVYVPSLLFDTVSVIDTTTNPATVSTIETGSLPPCGHRRGGDPGRQQGLYREFEHRRHRVGDRHGE